jgi:hypothetical protein
LACEGYVGDPRGLLLHAGFRYVEGNDTFHVIGGGLVRRMRGNHRH